MTGPRDESLRTPSAGAAAGGAERDAERDARALRRAAERAAERAAQLVAEAEEVRRTGRGAGSTGRLAGVGARGSAGEAYYYRRPLGLSDLATAAGIGIGAAVAAFYVASLLIQRTPLDEPRRPRGARPAPRLRGRAGDADAR